MFSIIIPLYNKAAYVQKAIDSIISQTCVDFELIVVNDGSTDNSHDIVKAFDDERILIHNQVNSGVSTARNNGVALAKYNYIAFLDADDWWDKDFLKEMSLLINKYNDAAIYASRYFIVKNAVQRKANIGVDANFKDGYINYYDVYAKTFCMPITSSSVVLNKTLYERVEGFNTKLKFGEDFDLWLRLTLNNKVVFSNKCLAYYNQDVPVQNRALGNKLWKMQEHFIFNIAYLQKEEEENKELKILLDGLRVRSLIRYKRNGLYKKETTSIIKKVHFEQQPFLYTFIYKYPKFITEMYFLAKKKGSVIKQFLLSNFKND